MEDTRDIVPFSGEEAYRITGDLAEGVGARLRGTEAERRAAEYISDRLRYLGYPASEQEFPTRLGGESRNVLSADVGQTRLQYIVVGAHYDSVDGVQSANDNASGVAVMLEAARVLAGKALPHPVVFAAFGAEEGEHAGSKHFVAMLDSPDQVVGMINLDAVGVDADFELSVYGDVDPWLADRCREVADRLGIRTIPGGFGGKSDYASFADAGIPVACFARTDHPTAHTPDDNMSIISASGMEEIGLVLVNALC